MDDQPRQVATSPDSDFTLSIEEALERYARAGLPRTPRSIQRYAAQGHLEARLMETSFGVKYLITPASIDKHIAYVQEINDATSRDRSRQVALDNSSFSSHDSPRQIGATSDDRPRQVATGGDTPLESPVNAERQSATAAATSDDKPRQVATTDADTRYVARLESEVDFLRGQVATKDAQIKELTERSRETNVLIGGLQRMLAPLLGSPDPHQASQQFPQQHQQ
ncbi:MAG: hypothetical protein FJX45_17395 [Alphaproteobacteria bacterium]|nr:hypothetical protein [Alphaproteobacteria bacterium]MBM3655219.1 hypothetical protein [Alphaproteobacteria bacterium]